MEGVAFSSVVVIPSTPFDLNTPQLFRGEKPSSYPIRSRIAAEASKRVVSERFYSSSLSTLRVPLTASGRGPSLRSSAADGSTHWTRR